MKMACPIKRDSWYNSRSERPCNYEKLISPAASKPNGDNLSNKVELRGTCSKTVQVFLFCHHQPRGKKKPRCRLIHEAAHVDLHVTTTTKGRPHPTTIRLRLSSTQKTSNSLSSSGKPSQYARSRSNHHQPTQNITLKTINHLTITTKNPTPFQPAIMVSPPPPTSTPPSPLPPPRLTPPPPTSPSASPPPPPTQPQPQT